jgi:hypothetical protein
MEEKRMNKKELLELIKSIKIDKEEFIVLSSGALVLRGIMDSAGDLDILVTQKGFEARCWGCSVFLRCVAVIATTVPMQVRSMSI